MSILIITIVFDFSERFLVKISKEGFSNYLLKLHNNCTIFTVSTQCRTNTSLWSEVRSNLMTFVFVGSRQ